MLSEKPWKLEQVVLLFLVMFASFTFFALVGAMVQHFHGPQKLPTESLSYLLLATISIHGSILLGIGVVIWWWQLGWSEAFGLATPGRIRAILLGIWAAALFLPIGLFLKYLSLQALAWLHHYPTEQQAVVSLQNAATWESQAYLVFFSVLVAPVAEEMLFRGVFYPAIKQAGFPRLALWGTALLFAVIHLSIAIFVPLIVLGLVLIWLYERTGNLLASIAAHSAFNAANLVFFYFGPELSAVLNRWLHHPQG